MSRERQAGIAQLVEQATENRRVPSSNLGPGIRQFLVVACPLVWFRPQAVRLPSALQELRHATPLSQRF